MSEGLWTRSEVLPDGTYGVGVSVGEDRAWVLSRAEAVAYAVACVARATEAEHDAAVLSLLTSVATSSDSVAAAELVVRDIREQPDDEAATKPLRFTPQLGVQTRRPFLRMELDGKPCGELTTADLRDHAQAVLSTLAAADLDAALLRLLVGTVGLAEDVARGVIGELGEHWPEPEAPRGSGG